MPLLWPLDLDLEVLVSGCFSITPSFFSHTPFHIPSYDNNYVLPFSQAVLISVSRRIQFCTISFFLTAKRGKNKKEENAKGNQYCFPISQTSPLFTITCNTEHCLSLFPCALLPPHISFRRETLWCERSRGGSDDATAYSVPALS